VAPAPRPSALSRSDFEAAAFRLGIADFALRVASLRPEYASGPLDTA